MLATRSDVCMYGVSCKNHYVQGECSKQVLVGLIYQSLHLASRKSILGADGMNEIQRDMRTER
jgi:hypothetical protein